MLPIKLEIHNFLAYRAPDPVRFDGIHLACLTGANGAGKSSLLDAITWALWGKARAKRDEELIHLGQNDMSVQLDFEQEGTVYRVWRQRTRKNSSAGTLELFSIGVDGELVALTEQNMRATQLKINRLLRLDHETFVHSAFLQQGRADAFTTKTPQERKKILTEILGLMRWEGYEEGAKAELRIIERDLSLFENDLRNIDAELGKEAHLRATLEQAKAAQDEAKAALEIAEKLLDEVKGSRNDLMNAQSRLAEIDKRIQERSTEKATAKAEIERQRAKIATYETVIARRGEIEAGYDALQSARAADSSLGDLLMQITDLDKRQSALERDLESARTALLRDLSLAEAEIATLDDTIQRASPDDLADLQAEIAQLRTVEDDRDRLTDTVNALEQESAALKATNAALKTEMDAIKERLDTLRNVSAAACPLCGQPLTDEHRTEMIAEIELDGKARGDQWRANKARMENITGEIKAARETLTRAQEQLRLMPELQARSGELQASVDSGDKASARRAAADAHAEGLRAALAAEQYAPDVRAELATTLAQRSELGYDSERHTAARQDVQTYLQFEQQRTQLEVALEGMEGAQEMLRNGEARAARLERAIADEGEAHTAMQVEIARLEVLAKEQQTREAEVLKQRMNLNNAILKTGEAQQSLKSLETLRIKRVEVEAKQAARRQDRELYEELRDAFGKKGVPAVIIESAIPELESSANRLLTRMTDGRMQLKLETQREKITGGVIETLDIQIADELGTRNYEMYSGGEAFRINFALRVALSQLLARRAGAHLRTLFIDEGFGTQDEDGRNKLVEAITAIQDTFDIILVVTHIDDLRDSFPVHLQVTKTGDGSYVAVR
jgi:DNA repair protein SbcC/Rad50